MNQPSTPLRFGVNYTPSKNWWYSWMDWDEASIRRDLLAVRDLGMDHIRIHCLWPWFQPEPDVVRPEALLRLKELLDIAGEANLDVCVTVLDGWLSGINFIPAWQGDGDNIYTTPKMIAAEKVLFQAMAETIRDHPHFLGFDLGNELGVLHRLNNPAGIAESDAWFQDILNWCDTVAPGKLHVNGVDHIHWFSNIGFSRPALANIGRVTSLHTYDMFTGMTKSYGSLGSGVFHIAEYCIELARAYTNDHARQFWIQEFGGLEEGHPVLGLSHFAEQTIRNAASCQGLWGFTWWCSHDFYGRYAELSPFERALGLLDCNNRVKPAGERIARLIEEFRRQPPAVVSRPTALILPDEIFTDNPKDDLSLRQFIAHYMQRCEKGERPAIVLKSRASDTSYLAARGITNLVEPEFYQVGKSAWTREWFSEE